MPYCLPVAGGIDMPAVTDYLRAVRQTARGEPTEHSYRSAVETLLEALRPGAVATNEPKHRRDCGAPDMSVADGTGADALRIGYLECKDIGVSLDEVVKSDQLKRYLGNLDNLVLTDYLEFRWFVEGEERARATLATPSGTPSGSPGAPAWTVVPGGAEAVEELLTAFLSAAPEPIRSPAELARRMAKLTRMIHDIIVRGFERKEASDLTRDLFRAFEKTLLPKITQEQFADMFAQTLAYGLFAARVNHRGPQPFQRLGAAREIPKTNPFLRKLFDTITGLELDDEPYAGFVDDLTRLLAHADIGAILADFGARTRRDDPIVHFYETFLAAYDPKLREMRGVYYTPEPVVSYIVRSVDWILREHFGLPDGLADRSTVEYEVQLPSGEKETRTSPKVLILDPACGTGTFLYHVIDHIRRQFVRTNNAGMWPGFVRDHLLPRLFGFELLMAPYAVAHLKLGMQLAAQDMTEEQRARWAYDFPDDQRLGVYLTNTLEEAESYAQTAFGPMRTIVEEANAAAEVKRDMPIMVIIGNPPYSGISSNKGPWIDGLLKGELPDGTKVDSYYEVDGKPLGERKAPIDDDYVKFIRWAQWRIEQTGAGVLAFITNHGYLDNPTFRGMRQSLMDAFTDIYVLNVHGNSLKKEVAPNGTKDENVFDIRQGVAIVLLLDRPRGSKPATLNYADLWGRRDSKYAALQTETVVTTGWTEVEPVPPFHMFVPVAYEVASEQEGYTSVVETFRCGVTGVMTSRDAFLIANDFETLQEHLELFCDPELSDSEVSNRLSISENYAWTVADAREELGPDPQCDLYVRDMLYRPFDVRRVYYHPAVVWRTRNEVMRHMLAGENIALVTERQDRLEHQSHFLASKWLVDYHALGTAHSAAHALPLYLYPDPERIDDLSDSPWPPGRDGRRPNLSEEFVDELAGKLGLEFVPDGRRDLQATFGPEDIFDYIYAVFHAPTYRERYAEFLKIDFPRVPLTSDVALFRDLVALGGRLVALHLMESPELDELMTNYPNSGDNVVEKGHPKYYPPGEAPPGEDEPLERGRVYINRTKRKADAPAAQYFDGVPPEVWEFHVGGYQVLGKWLKDRRGRELEQEDLRHYQRIVVALSRTMAIMARIDARIEEWPIE